MTAAPRISRRDLESKLEELCSAERRHFVFALHGTGDAGRVHLDQADVDVEIVPVRSELELRRKLLELDGERPTAYLVPWNGTVPMDLGGRFAKFGRVFRVGPETERGSASCSSRLRRSEGRRRRWRAKRRDTWRSGR